MKILSKIAVCISFFAAGFVTGTEFMSVLYGHETNYGNLCMIVFNFLLGISNLALLKYQKPVADETLA